MVPFSIDFYSVEASHRLEQFELLGSLPPFTTQSLGATAFHLIRHLCTLQLQPTGYSQHICKYLHGVGRTAPWQFWLI